MVVLINHQGLKVYKGLQLQSPSPPIGLAYLSGFLKSRNISVKTIDACGENMDQLIQHSEVKTALIQGLSNDEVIERIPAEASIIGISCNFSSSWPLVHKMVQSIKAIFPDAVYILGGEHGTAFPEICLAEDLFDCVVMGEGEETFYEMCTCILGQKNWRNVHGIAYLENGNVRKTEKRTRIIGIDSIPYPDWDGWFIEEYISRNQVTGIHLGKAIPILGSRGCPYSCKFCSNKDMWTTRYIMREPKDLVDEMEQMVGRYGVNNFTFMDSTFIVNRKKTLAFAEELIQRNLSVTYQLPAGTRCEAFDEELAFKLAESGLKNFAFAPESGDEGILKHIRKKIDIQKFLAACGQVLKTDMTVGCFFVIGFPEDTSRSLKNTLSLIRKIAWKGVHDITVSQFTPYPGSDYFKELSESGKLEVSPQNLSQVMDFFSDNHESYCEQLSAKTLYRWMIWMYLNFYILSIARRPWRFVENLYLYWTKGIENTRYVRLYSELMVKRKGWLKKLK